MWQEEFEAYGIDWDGPVPGSNETPDVVTVPETLNPLTPQNFQELCQQVDPLRESANYAIHIFMHATSFLER